MKQRELEVKILGIDPDAFEKKLIESGAEFIGHETQENRLFLPKALENSDSYLRIRIAEDKRTKECYQEVTFKENIKNDTVRANIEYTTRIEDSDMMTSIFEKIGIGGAEISFKDRKRYRLADAIVEIDIWDKNTYPYPYAEIEVEAEADLGIILAILNISKEQVSKKSIKQLIDEYNGSK